MWPELELLTTVKNYLSQLNLAFVKKWLFERETRRESVALRVGTPLAGVLAVLFR